MAIFDEEVHVVVDGEDKRRLGPEGDIRQPKLLGQGRWPHGEGVGDEDVDGGLREQELSHQLLDMGGEQVVEGIGELIPMQGPIEGHGQAVAHELVADVQAHRAGVGEDLVAVNGHRTGGGALVVKGLGGDEGDDETPGGDLDGEVGSRRKVTLEGRGHEDGVVLGDILRFGHFSAAKPC